jgi:hypothetical protein
VFPAPSEILNVPPPAENAATTRRSPAEFELKLAVAGEIELDPNAPLTNVGV